MSEAYQVIARKWRPQQFGDVVGQEHVTHTLVNALKTNRVAHAYLFVGPRGVGKTSTARILAKALNCERGPTPNPCDKCDSCKEIMAGNNLDVLEIDAASNTGVDNVRDLRENARYVPARSRFKIYIIDEVHMLSTGAFNALLKTLEEPPKHVKFIFATTEPQKVLATILSRCQRFDLRRIPLREIIERLSEIAKDEKITIDEDALLAIARGAEGGLRDAESALDQLISFRGAKIAEKDVLSVFGLVARHTLEGLAESVLKGDVPKAIRIIAELDESGKDLSRVVIELLEHFRNLLIYLYAGEKFSGPDLTEAQIKGIKAQAALTESGKVLRVVEILTETENRMRYALSRRTLFETGLIRSSRVAATVTIDAILAQLEQLRAGLGTAAVGNAALAQPVQAAPASGSTYAPSRETQSGTEAPKPASAVREKPADVDEVQWLSENWLDMVERVGHAAPLAKGYLVDAKPIGVIGNHVKIAFDPEFAANKAKIDFPRNIKTIQKVLGELLGRSVTIEFCVLDAKDTLPGDVKMPVPHDKGKTGTTSKPSPSAPKTRQEWAKDPAVRKTLEMFNGDVVDVRE